MKTKNSAARQGIWFSERAMAAKYWAMAANDLAMAANSQDKTKNQAKEAFQKHSVSANIRVPLDPTSCVEVLPVDPLQHLAPFQRLLHCLDL